MAASIVTSSKLEPIKFSAPYFGEEEALAAADVVRSQWVVGGPKLQLFEERFATLCGASHAVGVSSWTTGAFLVLKALGIGPGDEVIVPSSTFIASVNVIAHAGATPVFADVDPLTWNIDPTDVERKITPKTKLILPVDQLGLPCDMDAMNAIAKRHNLLLIEDAACAFGSHNAGRPIGSLCDITIFSLHARKIITTGEGGIIVTKDKALADRLRRLRHQGMSLSDFERHGLAPTVFEEYPEIGYNFRITDIQAGIGLAQLDRLNEIILKRKLIADRYHTFLKQYEWISFPQIESSSQTNWQTYQIKLNKNAPMTRNNLMQALFEKNIPTRRGVMASHLEAPYRQLSAQLPVTEDLSSTSIQLPMHPALNIKQLEYILETFQGIVEQIDSGARKAYA